MSLQLETKDDYLVYTFFRNTSGYFKFRVRADHDARIALSPVPSAETSPVYEIYIGGWKNTKSVIRKNLKQPEVAEVPTPGILSGKEFRDFWISWGNGAISAGRQGEPAPFIKFVDPHLSPLGYVGLGTGWGATGSWILPGSGAGGSGSPGSGLYWVPARNGNVPPNAVIGGEDNGEPLYVIRANLNGNFIPGKLLIKYGLAYIAWGGKEYEKPEYEVLCYVSGNLQSCSCCKNVNIPHGAHPAKIGGRHV